jgi:hypothetical protein
MKNKIIAAALALFTPLKAVPIPLEPYVPNIRDAVALNLRRSRKSQQNSQGISDYFANRKEAIDGVMNSLEVRNDDCD